MERWLQMPASKKVHDRVHELLQEFLNSTGRVGVKIHDQTHLKDDLGLSSDEGVDFALDLCDGFKTEFPLDFNPFIEDSGRRGRKFNELVQAVETLLSTAELER